MTTSVALSEANRDRLARIKEDAGLRSMDEVVGTLLGAARHSIDRLMENRGERVAKVADEHGIRRLTAYGSRVWGAPHARSDVDLVAEFDGRVSMFELMRAERALADAFGAPVDLTTWGGLRDRLAERVRREGVVILG